MAPSERGRHEAELAEVPGPARHDGGVVFAAAVRADAGGAAQRRRSPCRSRCSRNTTPTSSVDRSTARHSARSAKRARAARAVATATTSALELDMPAARGRSLAKTRSRPSAAPGKLLRQAPRHDLHVRRPAREGARPSSAGSMSGVDARPHVAHAHPAIGRAVRRPRRSRAAPPPRAYGRRRSRCACRTPRAGPARTTTMSAGAPTVCQEGRPHALDLRGPRRRVVGRHAERRRGGPASRHRRGSTPVSRWLTTPTSARLVRSSTAPARHEHAHARAARNGQHHGVGQLVLASRRERDVAAGGRALSGRDATGSC